MNCKEGDLAMIVKSKAGNEGKIVRCIQYVGAVDGVLPKDCWLIDGSINCVGTVTKQQKRTTSVLF